MRTASLSVPLVALTMIVIASLAAPSAEAQKGKPGGGGGGNTLFPVTAEFRCPFTVDCQLTDAITGDAIGPYRGTTPNGAPTTQEGQAENQGAYFTEGGLFLFVLKSGFGRLASFDFSSPIGAPPCVSKNNCRKNFISATTDVSLPGSRTYPVDAMGADLPNGFNSIAVGASARARMYLNFEDPSGRDILWTVRFDPTFYPSSGLLTVTRPAPNTWTIEATANDVAVLESANTSGKALKINEGYYRMPYKITVVR